MRRCVRFRRVRTFSFPLWGSGLFCLSGVTGEFFFFFFFFLFLRPSPGRGCEEVEWRPPLLTPKAAASLPL